MKTSICFVGCGRYAAEVLNELNGNISFDLYFASRNESKSRSFAEKFNGKGYFGSYHEAASATYIDALYFLTPHNLHLENVKMGINNGKHVLIEKPIAHNLEDALEIVRLIRESNLVFMLAENFRFLPTIVKSKELITSGVIGDLRLVQVQRELNVNNSRDVNPLKTDDWRQDISKAGGGKFLDAGIHDVDAMVNLGGYPESVYALEPPALNKSSGLEDGMLVSAKMPDGAIGLIQFSFGTPIKGFRDNLWVTGTKGMLSFSSFGTKILLDTPAVSRTIRTGVHYMGMLGVFDEFISAIKTGKTPAMTAENGLKDLEVVMAVYHSIQTGYPVNLTNAADYSKDSYQVPYQLKSPMLPKNYEPFSLL
mgnify:CR=1 FL=1